MKKTRLFLIAFFSIFAVLLLTKHAFAQDTYRASLLKGIKARFGKGRDDGYKVFIRRHTTRNRKSHDSKTLVMGGGSLRSWDVDTGTLTVDLNPYLDADDLRLIRSLAFSPDGETLAVGDWSGILLWEWERNRLLGNPL